MSSDDRRERLKAEEERLARERRRSDVNFWRPEVGKNIVRILPHWTGDMTKVFYKKAKIHFGVGPDKSRVICPKTEDERAECPICDYVSELSRSGRREDVFLARELQAKTRYVVNIVDINDKEAGVQVWEMGPGLFHDILVFWTDDEYGDLDDLETGRHLTIRRTGEGRTDTRYQVIPAAHPSKVSPNVLRVAVNLDELYAPPSVEEIKAILAGEDYIEETEETADEEDDIPFIEEPSREAGESDEEDDLLDFDIDIDDGVDEPLREGGTGMSRRDEMVNETRRSVDGRRRTK